VKQWMGHTAPGLASVVSALALAAIVVLSLYCRQQRRWNKLRMGLNAHENPQPLPNATPIA
jgi:hypothetical protein